MNRRRYLANAVPVGRASDDGVEGIWEGGPTLFCRDPPRNQAGRRRGVAGGGKNNRGRSVCIQKRRRVAVPCAKAYGRILLPPSRRKLSQW